MAEPARARPKPTPETQHFWDGTQAGELPLIPEWALPYTGTPGSGTAVLPAYIVSEDMIEYHWLTDSNPRIFRLGLPNSLIARLEEPLGSSADGSESAVNET